MTYLEEAKHLYYKAKPEVQDSLLWVEAPAGFFVFGEDSKTVMQILGYPITADMDEWYWINKKFFFEYLGKMVKEGYSVAVIEAKGKGFKGYKVSPMDKKEQGNVIEVG